MTESSFAIGSHLDTVTELVRAAGDRSLEWYRTLERVDNKLEVGFDPVTEADRAVEAELRAALEARFPGHQILGEEFGTSGQGPNRWTIDPIDGTRAFITGQPMWGTLLGFQDLGADGGRPSAGWMHLPVLGETYIGHDTCRLRTTTGEREIRVRPTEQLEDAVILCTHPEMFAPGPEADAFARVAARCRMVRYSGDCLNYGLVAMGLADAVVENGLASYDIVPLIPIVESAGGIVTDLDGNSPLGGGYVVASATRALHDTILGELSL